MTKKLELMKCNKCTYPRSTRKVSRHTLIFRLRTPAELKCTNQFAFLVITSREYSMNIMNK